MAEHDHRRLHDEENADLSAYLHGLAGDLAAQLERLWRDEPLRGALGHALDWQQRPSRDRQRQCANVSEGERIAERRRLRETERNAVKLGATLRARGCSRNWLAASPGLSVAQPMECGAALKFRCYNPREAG